MRILIVDDNEDDRTVLRYLTERHGHQAVEAHNGVDALEKARVAVPDLIISDALMPVMDGYHFLRSVKQTEGLREVPFIFYSASYKGDQDVRLALSLGADAYFVKPVDPVELWERIEGLLAAKARTAGVPTPLVEEDLEYLKRYSEVVATQLEEKVRELEQTLEKQRHAEAALRESEAKFRSLAETSPAGIIIHQGGRYRYANAVFEAVTGYTREEILAMHFWDLVHPDFQELVKERGQARAQGARPTVQYEFKIVTKSGAERWVEIRAVTIDFEGQPAVLATLFDVTERKRAEEALRESEELHRKLIAASPDAIAVTDLSGRITLASARARELFGVGTESSGVGRKVTEWIVSEDQDKAAAYLQQLLTTGRVPSREFVLRRDDGTRFDAEVTGALIQSADGSARGTILITRDVTERKRAEESLRKLSRAVEQSPASIVITDTSGTIEYMNPKSQK